MRLHDWQRELLRLSDTQIARLEEIGVTSLYIQVQAKMPRAAARALGYSSKASARGNTQVSLARLLLAEARPYDRKHADHIDGVTTTHSADNLRLLSVSDSLKNRKRYSRKKP